MKDIKVKVDDLSSVSYTHLDVYKRQHIIEAHNEKIYVESEFGIGSEFSFTLEKAFTKSKKGS